MFVAVTEGAASTHMICGVGCGAASVKDPTLKATKYLKAAAVDLKAEAVDLQEETMGLQEETVGLQEETDYRHHRQRVGAAAKTE